MQPRQLPLPFPTRPSVAPEAQLFLEKVAALPSGYSEGVFNNARYGVTLQVSQDGKRIWLFGEELGGLDRISFNLYHLRSGEHRLKPCEMSATKVTDFVMGYAPSLATTGSANSE